MLSTNNDWLLDLLHRDVQNGADSLLEGAASIEVIQGLSKNYQYQCK